MPLPIVQEKPPESNCVACPLRYSPYVPNELPTSGKPPEYVVVGEEPGPKEVPAGRPFVGPSGQLLDKFLRRANLRRADGLIMNAVPCRAGRYLTADEIARATECCAPHRERLLKMAPGKKVLTLGGRAMQALTGVEGILSWYGYPKASKPTLGVGDVLPAPHPAFVLREDGFSVELWRCVERFADMVRGKWTPPYWEEPPLFIDSDWARAMNEMDESVLAFDVETACPYGCYARGIKCGHGLDAQYAKLLCVSVSDGKTAVCFTWPPPDPETEVAFRRLYESEGVKGGHNFQHDQLSLEAHGFRLHPAATIVDSLNLHASAYPRLPHRLAIAAARYRMPRHKAEFHDEGNVKGGAVFEHAAAVKPGELRKYCALDSWTTAKLMRDLVFEMAGDVHGEETFKDLTVMCAIALDMRRKGLRVDMERREHHLWRYAIDYVTHQTKLTQLFPEVNFGSNGATNAVRTLFFKTLGCQALEQTKAGKPKMDAWTLQRWAAGVGSPSAEAAEAAKLLLLYRRAAHMFRMVFLLPISPDGRVHPPWNAWGALTRRWSCSKPNMMNLPKQFPNNLRDLFVPDDAHHTFVAADMSKVELRVIALLAGDKALIEAFAANVDVHQVNAMDLFGPTANKQQRDMAKRLVYGFNYGAMPETVWKALVPFFPKLQLSVVTYLHKRWFEKHPAIKIWHNKVRLEAARKGVVYAPVGFARTMFFEGGVDPSKVYNFPIQAAVAFVVNRAMVRLVREGYDVRIQCHDELVLHALRREVNVATLDLMAALEEPVALDGVDNVLPCDPSTGDSWGTIAPYTPYVPC